MRCSTERGLTVALLFVTAAYAVAEEITLTTYYPSPRGVYETLRTTGQTTLAEQGGTVTVGAAATPADLAVNGNLTTTGLSVGGNLNVTGTTTTNGITNAELLTTGDFNCTQAGGCVASDEVTFNYAGSDSKGGPATNLTCTSCVAPGEVSFNYAGSGSQGGALTTSLSLAADPPNCGPGLAAAGISSTGAAQGCITAGGGGLVTYFGTGLVVDPWTSIICPRGQRATGGGCVFDGKHEGTTSRPIGASGIPTGWYCSQTPSGALGSVATKAYVICM